jgi:hypothetical protein
MPGQKFKPPLWLRWVLSLGVSAGLLVALVLFVDHHNSNSLAPESPAAALRANREAAIVVSQDQAPHVLAVGPGTAPVAALERAVRASVTTGIDRGVLDGPLQRTVCTPTGSRGATRRAFRCTVTANDVNYQFVGVVDVRARRLTYCKRDPPPVPSETILVSHRCLA